MVKLTLKATIVSSVGCPYRYVFHETDMESAGEILKSGSIKGLYIDEEPNVIMVDEDLEEDYGNWVYTCTFTEGNHFSYMGIRPNEVMFVIDTTKLNGEGIYEKNLEGGLYKIPERVPLTALEGIFIDETCETEDPELIDTVMEGFASRRMEVFCGDSNERINVIKKYRGR